MSPVILSRIFFVFLDENFSKSNQGGGITLVNRGEAHRICAKSDQIAQKAQLYRGQ